MKIKPQLSYGDRVRAEKAESMAIDIRKNALQNEKESERTHLASNMFDAQKKLAREQARFSRAQFAIQLIVSLRDKSTPNTEESDADHAVRLKALSFLSAYFDELNAPEEEVDNLTAVEKATLVLEGAAANPTA